MEKVGPSVIQRFKYDELPDAVLLNNGSIWFKHYVISSHAICRFIERTGLPIESIVPSLASGVIAILSEQKKMRIYQMIREAEEKGCYVLVFGYCYFVICINPKGNYHVVKTVITSGQFPSRYFKRINKMQAAYI
jgi:hypothetical protein